MLRLVVVPCLTAHTRHGRDPPPSPITLLGGPFREMAVDSLTDGVSDRVV